MPVNKMYLDCMADIALAYAEYVYGFCEHYKATKEDIHWLASIFAYQVAMGA